jgi:hypothetical protein
MANVEALRTSRVTEALKLFGYASGFVIPSCVGISDSSLAQRRFLDYAALRAE